MVGLFFGGNHFCDEQDDRKLTEFLRPPRVRHFSVFGVSQLSEQRRASRSYF
jgi:hypothetical protein